MSKPTWLRDKVKGEPEHYKCSECPGTKFFFLDQLAIHMVLNHLSKEQF